MFMFLFSTNLMFMFVFSLRCRLFAHSVSAVTHTHERTPMIAHTLDHGHWNKHTKNRHDTHNDTISTPIMTPVANTLTQ